MNKSKLLSAALVVAIATTTASCHIYKKFEMPEEGIAGEVAAAQKEAVDSTALGNVKWEQVFTDPQLQALIQIALDSNVDLENARLNNKRNAEAAVLQTEAYRQAVRSQIISGVANCYYTIAMLQRQLQILNETSAIWQESIKTMQDLKEAGRYNEVAVVQSKANYASLLATIPQVEESLHQVNSSLSLLLNRPQQTWVVDSSYEPSFPEYMEKGVPMSYLAARPDVQAAEQSLAMAYYATNTARAAFYPSLVISAGGGFTNLLGSVIVNPGKWFYQLAGQLTAPLFSRGRNIATLKAAKLQQQQTLNTFEHTVLAAGAEVGDALVSYNKNKQRSALLVDQVDNLSKAVEYNNDLMKYSTATYLEVLTAQQSLLNAQMSQLQCELQVRQAAISLYQALGGGR